MRVYIQCTAKTSGMDFTKGHFVGILGYLMIIRSMALMQTGWLWPQPAFTKRLPSGTVCLWQCSCSMPTNTLCQVLAAPALLAATTYTGSSRDGSSLGWAADSGVYFTLLHPNPSMLLWIDAGTCFLWLLVNRKLFWERWWWKSLNPCPSVFRQMFVYTP